MLYSQIKLAIFDYTPHTVTCRYAVFTYIATFIRIPVALLPVVILLSQILLYLSAHLSPYYLPLCCYHRYCFICPHTSRPITCGYTVFTDIAKLSTHLSPYCLSLCCIHICSYIYPHTSRLITCRYAVFTDIAIFVSTHLSPYCLSLCCIHICSYIYPHTSRPITCWYTVFVVIHGLIFPHTPHPITCCYVVFT